YFRFSGMSPVPLAVPGDGAHALARDATNVEARFEPGIVTYLNGPEGAGMSQAGEKNRCVHLAGGRIAIPLTPLCKSIEFWFWNGMPNEARDVTGYLFSYGRDESNSTDDFYIGGTVKAAGHLIYQH